MGMQSMSTSPARDTSRAISAGGGVKPGEIKLPPAHASTVTSSEGRAPVSSGPSVQGFRGSGTLKAYLK